MNVENAHSSGHSPVSQIATHVLCILFSTVSPPALNSSAETSSGPVALRLAVWRMARTTSERSGGGSCSQYSCSVPFPFYHGARYLGASQGCEAGDRPLRRCVNLSRRQHLGKRAFRCSAPAVWNSLPQTVLSSDSVAVFKLRLKTFLFSQAFSSFSAH